jgi:hypothetical protein
MAHSNRRGVYVVLSSDGGILYVGQMSLVGRPLGDHFRKVVDCECVSPEGYDRENQRRGSSPVDRNSEVTSSHLTNRGGRVCQTSRLCQEAKS